MVRIHRIECRFILSILFIPALYCFSYAFTALRRRRGRRGERSGQYPPSASSNSAAGEPLPSNAAAAVFAAYFWHGEAGCGGDLRGRSGIGHGDRQVVIARAGVQAHAPTNDPQEQRQFQNRPEWSRSWAVP